MPGGRGGGGYRDAYHEVWGCRACRGRVLEREQGEKLGDFLANSVLVRDRTPAMGCTACMATMQRLVLSWDSDWVEIEECPRCKRVFVQEGELEATRYMARVVFAKYTGAEPPPKRERPIRPAAPPTASPPVVQEDAPPLDPAESSLWESLSELVDALFD